MRLRVFNVKYSPNLGDGLLSECLEKALIDHGADPKFTKSVDFAGRTHYEPGSSARKHVLALLERLPSPLRMALLQHLLAYRRKVSWQPHYEQELKDCEAIVIGGGNLFTDMDLNFPIKISTVLSLAAKRGIPVAIFGVGVGAHWSVAGKRMVSKALADADLRLVAVRDEASRENFLNNFRACYSGEVKVVRDPGLLVSRYVPAPQVYSRESSVGVCVTSALAVRYHSSTNVSDVHLAKWYKDLLSDLKRRGIQVRLFTNGSPEDVDYAARYLDEWRNLVNGGEVYRPSTPTELSQFIAGMSIVLGFRMHALIAAASYGRLPVALRWDPKLDAFMESIGQEKRIYSVLEDSPAQVAEKISDDLLTGAAKGVPNTIADAWDNVKICVDSLRN